MPRLQAAWVGHWGVVLAGAAPWGMHLGMTQGLLARMVALLVASAGAGLLWDRYWPAATFVAGAGLATVALVGAVPRPHQRTRPTS